jgi:hypothetical protein
VAILSTWNKKKKSRDGNPTTKANDKNHDEQNEKWTPDATRSLTSPHWGSLGFDYKGQVPVFRKMKYSTVTQVHRSKCG